MDGDVEGVEDAPVLMLVQAVLSTGIMPITREDTSWRDSSKRR